MSGEGSRSTRFAPRNARWAHNHRVTWLADGGASEDLAVFDQQPSTPPYGASAPPYGTGSLPYGNGNGNGHDGYGYNSHAGNGHAGNGHAGNGHNGNGHSYAGNGGNGHGNGNGQARKLDVTLSEGERAR